MKKSILGIFFLAAMVAGVSSCKQSVIEPLTGKFPAPTKVEVKGNASNLVNNKDKANKQRTISFELTEGSNTLHVNFAADFNKYYLPGNTYTFSTSANAKKGTYFASTVNGKEITSGSFIVKEYSESHDFYGIDAMVFVSNSNEAYHITWDGFLEFEPEAPEAADYMFTSTESVPTDASGNTYPDLTKYTMTITKDGDTVGGLELVVANGSDITGKYTVASYAHEDHTAGNGYDLSVYIPGWVGGTYLYVDGALVLIDEGETLEVTLDKTTGWYTVKTAKFEYTMEKALTTYTMTDDTTGTVTDTDGQTVVPGFTRHSIVLKEGETIVAMFDLVVKEGSDIEGEYSIAGYPHEDHVAGNGWDASAWGYGMGGCIVAAGEENFLMQGGTINVTANSDGSYTFKGTVSGYTNVTYTQSEEFSFALKGKF